MKVATIQKIVGKRLHVCYYDAEPDDNGFWCHEDSPLIHPVGWARRVGQTIDAPEDYLQRCEESLWGENDATDEYFHVLPPSSYPPGVSFQVYMSSIIILIIKQFNCGIPFKGKLLKANKCSSS